jgi:hypothetical protein
MCIILFLISRHRPVIETSYFQQAQLSRILSSFTRDHGDVSSLQNDAYINN